MKFVGRLRLEVGGRTLTQDIKETMGIFFDAGFVVVPVFKPYHLRKSVNLEVVFEINRQRVDDWVY